MANHRRTRITEFVQPFLVDPGRRVHLAEDFDPAAKHGLVDKQDGAELLTMGVELLAEYQERLAAQDTYAVLVVLQALDAAGKDGTIRHVMSGVNPQGVGVHSFKVPSAEELDHDFLWRYARRLPARGEIGIFNRSHYEEVLVVRVHPEFLERQHLPPRPRGQGRLEAPLPRDQRLGALPHRQRLPHREAVPQRVEGGAAPPLPRAHRGAGEELEVLGRRRRANASTGTTTNTRISEMLSHTSTDVGAVARHPRRPQVVHARRRGGDDREHAHRDRSAVPHLE